ncbi:MAG: glycosyltransferase family 2 protein [Bellilinea sp.]
MNNARDYSSINIAVLIPCYNEQKTIVKVIQDFRNELPNATIYVFDNNSSDGSFELAVNSNAIVVKEKRQGKGFVLSAMLNKVVADIYVLVDGDDTYPAEKVHDLLAPVLKEETDMLVGQRLSNYSQHAFRPLHYSGNKLVCTLINAIFSSKLKDPMSGYRVFNRAVAIELPIVATGFDVETEMTLQLLYRHFKISEIEIPYRERPLGSFSKLNTIKDGFKVLYKILSIMQSYKPLTFFGGIGLMFFICSILVGAFVIREYLLFKYIYSVPKAILASGLMILGIVSVNIGIILHTINFRLLELSSNAAKLFFRFENSSPRPPEIDPS